MDRIASHSRILVSVTLGLAILVLDGFRSDVAWGEPPSHPVSSRPAPQPPGKIQSVVPSTAFATVAPKIVTAVPA